MWLAFLARDLTNRTVWRVFQVRLHPDDCKAWRRVFRGARLIDPTVSCVELNATHIWVYDPGPDILPPQGPLERVREGSEEHLGYVRVRPNHVEFRIQEGLREVTTNPIGISWLEAVYRRRNENRC